jgi:hypothetical protein
VRLLLALTCGGPISTSFESSSPTPSTSWTGSTS